MGQMKKVWEAGQEAVAVGQAKPPLTQAEKAAKTVDRMKTEAIHAQAMTLDYLRRKVDELEQVNKSLLETQASLKSKLLAANKVIEQLKGAPNGS